MAQIIGMFAVIGVLIAVITGWAKIDNIYDGLVQRDVEFEQHVSRIEKHLKTVLNEQKRALNGLDKHLITQLPNMAGRLHEKKVAKIATT